MSGIKIEIPDTAIGGGWGEELTLPSGIKARVRRGKGRDLRMAQMACGEPFDMGKLDNAMTARLSFLDGKPATFEQIEDLDIVDFVALKEAVVEANKSPSAPAGEDNASSGSPTSTLPA